MSRPQTFLVVFLIQNTQNRDAKVVQLKLDELLRAVHPARTALVHMEELTDRSSMLFKTNFRGSGIGRIPR